MLFAQQESPAPPHGAHTLDLQTALVPAQAAPVVQQASPSEPQVTVSTMASLGAASEVASLGVESAVASFVAVASITVTESVVESTVIDASVAASITVDASVRASWPVAESVADVVSPFIKASTDARESPIEVAIWESGEVSVASASGEVFR
jgi:phage tail sheath gpL-like